MKEKIEILNLMSCTLDEDDEGFRLITVRHGHDGVDLRLEVVLHLGGPQPA